MKREIQTKNLVMIFDDEELSHEEARRIILGLYDEVYYLKKKYYRLMCILFIAVILALLF